MRKKTWEKIKDYVSQSRYRPTFCHECGIVFYAGMYLEMHQKETGHKNGAEYEVSKKIRNYSIDKVFEEASNIQIEPMYRDLIKKGET